MPDPEPAAGAGSDFWPASDPSPVRVLSAAVLARVLERDALITVQRAAMQAFSAGQALQPLRTVMRLPGAETRLLAAMPGHLAGVPGATSEALGAKLVSVFPGNAARGLESHYGAVLLFDPLSGRPAAVLDGTFITAARTAAVSAVSVEVLARADAAVLTVFGAGVQAGAHLWALAEIRPWREARVISRSPAHARALVDRVAPRLSFPVRAVAEPQQAAAGADVIVMATSASEPLIARGWIAPGAHLVAVGSSTPAARELDSATVQDSLVVVDSRESALVEAGDLVIPIREGLIGPDHLHAELGDVLSGRAPGRASATQLTLYKSVGIAVQDLAAAELALRRAGELGLGETVYL